MNNNALLLERVSQGDKHARDQLVEENMGLVWSIVRRFSNRGYDPEELSQVGAMGLIKAVQKFDPSFQVQFSTYAVPMILGEIKRFLRDDGPVKVSRSLKEQAIKGWRAAEQLRRALGRDPTINEIAAESGVEVENLIEAFDAVTPPESLSAGMGDKDGNETTLLDRIPSENHENAVINRVMVESMLNTLNSRERQILILRYFKGKTQTEISKIIGVSQVQISRIEKAALERLKQAIS